MTTRRNREYASGELEVILSLAPTKLNIEFLSELTGRSAEAISIVYRIAFGHGPFARSADIQQEKILRAKKRVGIVIERQTPRRRTNIKV
jgi:hypothetical protein